MESDRLSLRLLSGGMAEEEREYLVRQGFWLRMARERAGKSQQGAAEHVGLSGNSKSTISDYENGVTPAPQLALRKLAMWYGVPLSTFTEPEGTPFERLDQLARGAIALAREDSAVEQGRGRGVGGQPAARLRRRQG